MPGLSSSEGVVSSHPRVSGSESPSWAESGERPVQMPKASWAAASRCPGHTADTPQPGSRGAEESVPAEMVPDSRARAPRACGPLPSLPLRPFPWRPVGNRGDFSCKKKNQETDSKEGVHAGSSLSPLGRLDPSSEPLLGHPGCSLWSQSLFVFFHLFFS